MQLGPIFSSFFVAALRITWTLHFHLNLYSWAVGVSRGPLKRSSSQGSILGRYGRAFTSVANEH